MPAEYSLIYITHCVGNLFIVKHEIFAGVFEFRVVAKAAGELVQILFLSAKSIHGVIMDDAQPVFKAAQKLVTIQ